MVRRPRWLRCGGQATSIAEHVLVADPRQRGDVERVRDEVALGVAEVGAVEQDVGLVEDAVERHPPAAALGRSGRS